jgi:hypothetical protein
MSTDSTTGTLNIEDIERLRQLNPAWFKYYSNKIKNFDLAKFSHIRKWDEKEFIPGNIPGDFDPKFNKNHLQFLINSPDRKRYIDLDYYQRQFEKNKSGNLICNGGEVDQEVNLVDRKAKKVLRIGFYGPDSRIEDGKWFDKNNIVLYGIYDKHLMLETIDLETKQCIMYLYLEEYKVNSDYTKEVRLKKVKFL